MKASGPNPNNLNLFISSPKDKSLMTCSTFDLSNPSLLNRSMVGPKALADIIKAPGTASIKKFPFNLVFVL